MAAVVGEGVRVGERAGLGSGVDTEHGVENGVPRQEGAHRVEGVSLVAVRCIGKERQGRACMCVCQLIVTDFPTTV